MSAASTPRAGAPAPGGAVTVGDGDLAGMALVVPLAPDHMPAG